MKYALFFLSCTLFACETKDTTDTDNVPEDSGADDTDDTETNDTDASEDADGDGVLADEDCDDNNASVPLEDADCDGILTADDCDDEDASSTAIAEDADCDGFLTADDCDDNDESSTVLSEDADCDGVLADEDCDDNNASAPWEDEDCDGILTIDDCDDGDASSNAISEDADCDGILAVDDCNDNDELIAECFEEIAIGFEFIGTWDQTNNTLNGWEDSFGTQEAYVLIHIANAEFFSDGAGEDNENLCTLFALFDNQSTTLNTQEYDWNNPPTSSNQYPLNTAAVASWASFEGTLSILAASDDTLETCTLVDNSDILTNNNGNFSFGLDGMRFGISFGALNSFHESWLESAYVMNADNDSNGIDDLVEYFDENREGFVTQYVHINHPNSASASGYDFTGYDWNYATLSYMNADDTIASIPCAYDTTQTCYDLVQDPYDASLNVFVVSNAYWFEDIPNIDFSLLSSTSSN
ncbi:MAG: hypothetical protein VX278_21665 [Myxococcota bacterium]|nr:hypothetical protein [Myxococcota bacterium]